MNKIGSSYGTSGSRVIGKQHQQPQKRGNLNRFKMGRKAGELVEGIFLRLEAASPGTAWVDLEGETLLASLPEDLAGLAINSLKGKGVGASKDHNLPSFPLLHGDICVFYIEKIEPEPILKMLGQGTSRDYYKNNPKRIQDLYIAQAEAKLKETLSIPIAILAAKYKNNRSQVLEIMKNSERLSSATIQERRELFIKTFAKTRENASIYSEYTLYRIAIIMNLKAHGLVDLRLISWALPNFGLAELAIIHREKAGKIFAPYLPPNPPKDDLCFIMQTSDRQLKGQLWFGQVASPLNAVKTDLTAYSSDLLTHILTLIDGPLPSGLSIKA